LRVLRSSLITLACLVLPACGSAPTEGTVLAQVVIGTIDAGGTLDQVISAPTTVVSNGAFSVTVTTFGNSCTGAAGAEVIVRGHIATITPYDQKWLGTGCLDVLRGYSRTVGIVFTEPGSAVLRVRGRSIDRGDLVTIDHQVMVSAQP
jgi:hypothetical protein